MAHDIERYGYKCVTRAAFEAAPDRPPGLVERMAPFAGSHAVYDPNNDWEGWCLVGDDPAELRRETLDHIEAHTLDH